MKKLRHARWIVIVIHGNSQFSELICHFTKCSRKWGGKGYHIGLDEWLWFWGGIEAFADIGSVNCAAISTVTNFTGNSYQ